MPGATMRPADSTQDNDGDGLLCGRVPLVQPVEIRGPVAANFRMPGAQDNVERNTLSIAKKFLAIGGREAHGLGWPTKTTRTLLVVDETVDLDKHRGMAAQKATDVRRLLLDVEANSQMLRKRQSELEAQLLALPATCWPEVAVKARYLLTHYRQALGREDTLHLRLVEAVLADLVRLEGDD